MRKETKGISRRSFLKGAAALGAVTAVGAGSVMAEEAPMMEEEMEEVPGWLGTAPGITDDMCDETVEADVVIVGAGASGIAAARAASEAGASVIVVERTPDITVRGLVFGCLDSQLHKDLGAEYDKQEVVREIVKAQGNRVNGALWMKWANESGAAFDWFASILDPEEFPYFLEMWPNPPAYDNSTELRPQYCTGIEFVDWIGAVTKQYEKSVEQGAQYLFNTMALEIFKDENGVVGGVYAQKEDGTYIKVCGKNGVSLDTGDYSYNEDMLKALCPEFWHATGGKVGTVDTSIGYGHKMAIWAGAMMEPSPHAHMSHSFVGGFGGIGNTATLNLNTKGKRYMNEDVDGQSFTNQVIRQPGRVGIQVFDSNWEDMVWHQAISHGAPIPDKMDFEAMKASFEASVENPSFFLTGANTLEELFEKVGLPVETAVASVERYNELCHGGKDLDFGKRQDRMYPIETPPFFAARSLTAACICTAGIVVDENLRVLDENYDPIPHLWAAGNVAGGRYAAEYPVAPVVATSHGTAFTFGRSVGMQMAAGDAE